MKGDILDESSLLSVSTVGILDLLFPKRCVSCGRIGRYFCDSCRKGIRVINSYELICPECGRRALDGKTHPGCRSKYGLDGLTSFFHYSGPVREAVKTIKYRLVRDLASEFVSLVPDTFGVTAGDAIVIPVPLHTSRLRFRGFNQAEVIGEKLAERFGLIVCKKALYRIRKTEPQVSMRSRNERFGNMKNVFWAGGTVKNKSIMLFDDVFTTGATMKSAAHALKRAGAKHVWAVTMAR